MIHTLKSWYCLVRIVARLTSADVKAADERNDPYAGWVKKIVKYNVKLW